MPNDGKLGLIAGVMVVLVVAVFFYPKAGAGPVNIPGQPGAKAADGQPGKPPAQVGFAYTEGSTWKYSEPRPEKPVSKDPLLWP